MNYVLRAGQSVTFKHRVLIAPGRLGSDALDREQAEFGK
jgi:hypothetical protein